MHSPEELRRQANQPLSLAIKAQDQGQGEVAAQLMSQALKYLDQIGVSAAPNEPADSTDCGGSS